MTASTSVHRALADPSRSGIAAALDEAVGALDASELAELVGLHANTVRWHLGILEDAGLVRSHAERRATPGRPRRLWEAVPNPAHDDAGEHIALARALVSVVAGLPEAAADAEAAGRAWGRKLGRRATAHADEDPVAQVVDVLRERGFSPEVDGLDVVMSRCPFAELARESPDVVCGLHRGLVDGVLEELGSELEVSGLDVLPRPDACVLRLARRRRSPAARAAALSPGS